MSSVITINMPMIVSKHGPTGSISQAGPSATSSKGLKGFLARNRVTSPEPTEPTKSRFRSFVDEVSGRGTTSSRPVAQAGRAPLSTALPSTSKLDGIPPARRARPHTPDLTAGRARNAPNLPPAMQKGDDGRWQPPSLSKGSVSTSALARLRDDEDDHTARPVELKRGKSGLGDLFGAKLEKTLNNRKKSSARPFSQPPSDNISKKPVADLHSTNQPEKEDREMTLRAREERAERERTARQPVSHQRQSASRPDQATPPLAPTLASRPGSRHTSRVEIQAPTRGSKGLPAIPRMTTSTSHTHTSTPNPITSSRSTPTVRRQGTADSTSYSSTHSHYHLRLAVSLLIKTLISYVKGPEFSANTKNVEMKRLAEDRLAVLVRMEKSWSAEWIKIAMGTLEEGADKSAAQDIKNVDVGERAKERERMHFEYALQDGVLLCL